MKCQENRIHDYRVKAKAKPNVIKSQNCHWGPKTKEKKEKNPRRNCR